MLNLLPTIRKQALRRRTISQQLRFLTGVAVVATSFSVIMLFTTDWLLQRWLQDITVATKSDIISSAERSELQQLVSTISKQVGQTQPLLGEVPHPLVDIVAIVGPTPTDIQLHDYILNYTTHDLELSGTAENRDALVAYQQVINTIPGVRGAYLPLQDITSKEQVPFVIQATYESAPVDKTE